MRGGGDRIHQVGPGDQPLGWLGRFVVYGLLGWCVECLFTSVVDLASGAGDLRLMGHSYLWMHPIWGVGLLLGEKLTLSLQRAGISRATRALVGMAVCFAVEYLAGATLVALIGRCPWDYSASVWSVNGLIRLDYAPFWWMCGWLYEPIGGLVRRLRMGAREPAPEPAPAPELWPSGEARASASLYRG